MINIVLCDDDEKMRIKLKTQIEKYMNQKSFDYKIIEFSDYDNRFMKFAKQEVANRIFILDIETPTRSGIDVARIIRKYDFESPIIFVTGHNELGSVILSRDITFLSFINKFDQLSIRLKVALDNSMKILNKKHILRIEDKNSIYTIEFDKILYITVDSFARKTIIVTDKNEYRISLSMNKVSGLLPDSFIKTHKSCIVNNDRVSQINMKDNIITFDNGISIDMLSNKYKKVIGC